MKKKGNKLVVYSSSDDFFTDELSIKVNPEEDKQRLRERNERKKYLQQIQDLTKKEIPELTEIKLYEAIEKAYDKTYGN